MIVISPVNPMQDLCVARVRAIFRLPTGLAHLSAHPLIYVEWYTPLQSYADHLGMFTISPSTHNHTRRASIIPITDVVHICHLIPIWGRRMDPVLTQANALERCTRFYVNPYICHSDFVLLRYCLDRWKKHAI